MTRNMAGQNVEELHAHRLRIVREAPFEPRRPAWLDDEDALREEAARKVALLHDDYEAIDHHREMQRLG